MQKQTYYQETLKNHFATKVRRNPLYSLRKFAIDLNFSAGALSHIIWGRRVPSEKTAYKLAESLHLPEAKKIKFVQSALESQKKVGHDVATVSQSQPTIEENPEIFDVISEWYHYAILEYTYVLNADFSPKHIAALFGISEAQSQIAIDRLIQVGLLKKKGQAYKKTKDRFSLANKTQTSANLRKRQVQILEKTIDAVQTLPIEQRVASAMTMAIDKNKVELARKLIDRSLNRICDLLASESPTDVYELQMTFIPLSKEGTTK